LNEDISDVLLSGVSCSQFAIPHYIAAQPAYNTISRHILLFIVMWIQWPVSCFFAVIRVLNYLVIDVFEFLQYFYAVGGRHDGI